LPDAIVSHDLDIEPIAVGLRRGNRVCRHIANMGTFAASAQRTLLTILQEFIQLRPPR
jgi:hypothetical protein